MESEFLPNTLRYSATTRSFTKGSRIMATISPKAKEPEAIKPEDWARIWAHAWLPENKDFREKLKRDPKAAAEEFNRITPSLKIPPSTYDKIFNIVEYVFAERFTMKPFERKSFTTISDKGLAEIAAKGMLNDKPFCVQPNEWESEQ